MYTTRYKLFRALRLRTLRRKTKIAIDLWNYFLELQKWRYDMGHGYLNYKGMSREFTLRRNCGLPEFSHWQELDSWAARQILKRLDVAYQRFFSGIAKRPPKFKSRASTYSFTLGASGYAFCGDKVRIMGKHYRFNRSRPILGKVKTVTLKEDALGDFYMTVTTDHTVTEVTPKTGQAAGYDFGIKAMFTCSDGTLHESPEFYKHAQTQLKTAQRKLSKKKMGSGNRRRAKQDVARLHRKTKRRREDDHWKLAQTFVLQYDALCFETLSFEGMKRIWGKKVSDIAPHAFHLKLQHQARKHDKQVYYIDRWEPTSKTCSHCGQLDMLLTLSDREWQCSGCKRKHHRDVNAAINILKVGTSTFELEGVRLAIASNRRRNYPVSKPHNPTLSCGDSKRISAL